MSKKVMTNEEEEDPTPQHHTKEIPFSLDMHEINSQY